MNTAIPLSIIVNELISNSLNTHFKEEAMEKSESSSIETKMEETRMKAVRVISF